MFRWIPERIIFLLELRHNSCFKVLFRHVLDDVIPVGKFINIPPISISNLPIDHFDFDRTFFHVDLPVFSLRIHKHHFNTHGDVPLELFCNKVQLDTFREGFQKLFLKIIFLLYLLLLLIL